MVGVNPPDGGERDVTINKCITLEILYYLSHHQVTTAVTLRLITSAVGDIGNPRRDKLQHSDDSL